MMRRRMAFVLVAGAAVVIGICVWGFGLFGGLEHDSVDERFLVRGELQPHDKVALVEVDDVTFNDLGEQWPFPRSLHGKAIDRLTRAGAKVIAYDVQFTEPSEPAEDNALIAAVDRAGKVVLATNEVDEHGRSNVFGGESVLRSVGAEAGNTSTIPDDDGVNRRMPYEIGGLKNFGLLAAERGGANKVEASQFPEEGAWINFVGPAGTIPSVSFSELLRGDFDPDAFRDRIVVVGVSAPTIQDVHPTAVGGGLMPGAEIVANSIGTVLDGFPLHSAPPLVDIALIVLLALSAPVAGRSLRPLPTGLIALAVGGAFLVVAQLTFNAGLVLPVVAPLIALLVGMVGTLALHYLLVAFERQRVRYTFSRFVPENVVQQVLDQGEDALKLGGVRIEATLFFSDIRGFTTYSETRPPDEVVEVLNRYLGAMTDSIMDHGGTLVSYMGDGIMAVFGAPVAQEDHADRAIAAAREMLDVKLPEFCGWMEQAGHGEGFKIGIGLNSGEVMSGQVGSERRMEYTTIGDTTNTAARLEGMTKGSGYSLFISESTREACVGPLPELDEVGKMEVRGRDEPIQVWGLAGSG